MIEKTDTSVLMAGAGITAAAAPFVSNLTLIIIAAITGAAVAATRLSNPSKLATVRFMFRSIAITVFSAGAAAKGLESDWFEGVTGIKVEHSLEMLAFVAFWIAVVGDEWFKVKDWVKMRVQHILSRWSHGDR